MLSIMNLRPGGALRGKRRTVGWKGHRECCRKSAPPRLYPHLCRLRTDGLVPVSKYWMQWSHAKDICPINRYSLTSMDAWLFPNCFNDGLGRETGWGPVNWSADGLGIVSGALFLGSNDPAQLCWWLHERLPHMPCHERVCVMCIKFRLKDIYRFESPRPSDMSNRLSYGCQQIDKLMN
jgi:hypothetical protein